MVNPVALADTLWTDEYKLNKLMKEQNNILNWIQKQKKN